MSRRDRSISAYTTTTTKVVASATVVPLLPASNGSRLYGSIYNDVGSADLYVKLGEGAGVDDYGLVVAGGNFFVLPESYMGIVTGIWASAVGSARVQDIS